MNEPKRAVELHRRAAGAAGDGRAAVLDHAEGARGDARAVGRAGNDSAAVDHVVAVGCRQRRGAVGVGDQRAGVGHRIVEAGHGGDVGADDAALHEDADRLVLVDRVARGRAGARHGKLGPGGDPRRIDMHRPGVRAADQVGRARDQVEFAGAAAGGDALEVRVDGAARRVVLGEHAGALVEDIGVTDAAAAGIDVAAGDAVAPGAVGRGAGRPRLVVGGEGAARHVVDEGAAQRRGGVEVADHLVAELAVGDGVDGAGHDQRGVLLPGGGGAVEDVAAVGLAGGRHEGAGDAQDAAEVAEGRAVGLAADRAREVGAVGRRLGQGLEGAGREAIEQPAGAARKTVAAGDVVAAHAGDAGARAVLELQRLIGDLGVSR